MTFTKLVTSTSGRITSVVSAWRKDWLISLMPKQITNLLSSELNGLLFPLPLIGPIKSLIKFYGYEEQV